MTTEAAVETVKENVDSRMASCEATMLAAIREIQQQAQGRVEMVLQNFTEAIREFQEEEDKRRRGAGRLINGEEVRNRAHGGCSYELPEYEDEEMVVEPARATVPKIIDLTKEGDGDSQATVIPDTPARKSPDDEPLKVLALANTEAPSKSTVASATTQYIPALPKDVPGPREPV